MRIGRVAVILAVCVAAGTESRAQSHWMGASGGGMLSVQEASVLGPGKFAFGIVEDNYDRDPLGLDIVDVRMAWRLGLSRRWELYGHYDISRAVSVPGTQEIPPPPLDIVDLTGRGISGPYRTMYWPMPYLGDEPASVSDMTDGEYTFGAKWLAVSDPDITPHISLSLDATIPGTQDAWKLRKGSGAGTSDVTATIAATWENNGRLSASANLGYTLTGSVRRADLLVTPRGIRELPISRADLLRWGLGIRFRIFRQVSVMTEIAGWRPTAGRTPVQDDLPNTDGLAGLEVRVGPIALTLGVRAHIELQQHHQSLPTGPLGGAVDLSAVNAESRRAYLDAIGAPGTRPGTNVVVLGATPDIPLPAGARFIPEFRRTSTTGNGAIIAAFSFSF